MNEIDIHRTNILDLFGFSNEQICMMSNLINLSNFFNIDIISAYSEFNKPNNETYPEYHIKLILSELSWIFTEQVCIEYYPEVAIGHLEDFGIFFQDQWLENENDNKFYNFFIRFVETNIIYSETTKLQLIQIYYIELKTLFESY